MVTASELVGDQAQARDVDVAEPVLGRSAAGQHRPTGRGGGGRGAGAALRGVEVIASRELVRQLGKPGLLVTQGVQVLFFVLVYAVGFGSMIGPSGGTSFRGYVFPGIIAIHIVATGMNAGMSYAWDREYGFMREMLVAPVPRWSVPLGKIAGTAVSITVQCAVLLACGPLLDVRLSVSRYLLGLAACAGIASLFCSFGLMFALVVRRLEVLQGVVQLSLFPMLFLSGSVFDPAQAPGWLGTAMWANPMTYAVDLLRAAVLRPAVGTGTALAPAWVDLVVLAAMAAVVASAIRLRSGR